jgi:chorismate mutase/prephenate dehydratase
MDTQQLRSLRENIDQIDNELLRLIERRMEVAESVGRFKKDNALPVRDRERERQVLYRLCEQSRPELKGYIKSIYSVLFEASSSHQIKELHSGNPSKVQQLIESATKPRGVEFVKSATVACQGAPGAYSQIACDKLFRPADIMYCKDFEAVFKAVQGGLCKYGILPLQNIYASSVDKVYNLMSSYGFYIVRSIKLPIVHTLLAAPGAKLSDITEIISHEQAIRQCADSDFMRELSARGVKVTTCENTAFAAKAVADSGRSDIAAIASRECAEIYGLSVLSDSVQAIDSNHTRFVCVAREPEIYEESDKTGLMLELSNEAGSLYNILAKFNVNDINMTKLESRPIPGRDSAFRFYFDLDTPTFSPELKRVLFELEREVIKFDYLGTYREL